MTETFNASAQYNDWVGNAAADDDGDKAIRDLLRERKLIDDGELLVGVEIWVGEQRGGRIGHVGIHAYLIKAANAEEVQAVLGDAGTVPKVKKVSIDDLSVEQFVGLFKRFNVALSWQNNGLLGREIDTGE